MSATGYLLRQMIDRLEPGAALEEPLPALNRVLYCHRGSFSTGDRASCIEDVAWYGSSEIMVEDGPEGAVVWGWVLAPDYSEAVLPSGAGVATPDTLSAHPANPRSRSGPVTT